MESVPPVRVPIFFETTVETVATRAAQPPDTALHLFPDCTLRDTCELLWGADESSAAGVARKAPALVLSLIYPGEWPLPAHVRSLSDYPPLSLCRSARRPRAQGARLH